MSAKPPSIAQRISRTLWVWTIVGAVATVMGIGWQTAHEVSELLDDSLVAASNLIAPSLSRASASVQADPAGAPGTESPEQRFAWQWVSGNGLVLARSATADTKPWSADARVGYFSVRDWRVYGASTGVDGAVLYVAQSLAEKREASVEVALGGVLAVVTVGLVGHLWLRRALRQELAPIDHLGESVRMWRDLDEAHALGTAPRSELEPIYRALDDLRARLTRQIKQERAFSAHTAHALRTPLAGIDTQLAVAERDCREHQPELAQRLAHLRASAQRMQGVVESLLALFREGGQVTRQTVDLDDLLASVAVPARLRLETQASAPIQVDPDMLAAALFNLVDNAARHGADTVVLQASAPNAVRVRDNGPGVDATRMVALQAALGGSARTHDDPIGMGLWLAQRVAHAHGGTIEIDHADAMGERRGFEVRMRLG